MNKYEEPTIFYNTEEDYDMIVGIAHGLVDNQMDGNIYQQVVETCQHLMSEEQFDEFSRLIMQEASRYAHDCSEHPKQVI